MDIIPKGGRAKKAPYRTIIKRIPEDLELEIDDLIHSYRCKVIQGIDRPRNTDQPASFAMKSYNDAIDAAREILKKKKGAAESIANLLQVLYGGKCSKEDLK